MIPLCGLLLELAVLAGGKTPGVVRSELVVVYEASTRRERERERVSCTWEKFAELRCSFP